MTLRMPRGVLGLATIAVVSAFGAFILAAAAIKLGPTLIVTGIAGGVVALILLADARLAVTATVALFVLAETADDAGLPLVARLYEKTPAYVTPIEVLMLLAVGAVVLDASRRRERLKLPTPFMPVLALTAASLAFGILNAKLGPGVPRFALISTISSVAPLFLMPLLIVNVVRTREDLRRAVGAFAAFAVTKAILGLGVLELGRSAALSLGGPRLTHLEATPNFVIMTTLLGLVAAPLAGVKLPRWLRWAAPLVFLALLLSYRRMFWVATVATIIIVAVVASGRVGRRLMVPIVVVLALGVWLVAQAGVVGDLSGPVVQRGASLAPSKVTHNEQDRYRLAERRNIVAEFRKKPLTGLGVGVGWRAQYPMPFEYVGDRTYAHFAVEWWWLNMGALGAITYGWLVLSTSFNGLMVWRRHPDGVVRVGGLAAGAAVLGLAGVELTSTVLGADQRLTAIFGTIMGLLVVARWQFAPRDRSASDASLMR